MPYFMTDDQLPQNRKTRTLVEAVLDGNIEGLAALGLWTLAGAQAQVLGGGTDGLVSRADLVRVILNPQVADRLAAQLVAVGFWHEPGHDCARCPAVPQGHWLYHDWFAMGYTPAAQATTNRAKRQELKDPKLVAQVWARDCIDPSNPTIGRCRYCGTTLIRNSAKNKDTRSAKTPHLDHVDPYKAAGITNVVLACRECNQQKGNRTPRDAGMTLLPPPRPTLTSSAAHGEGDPASGPRDAVKASADSYCGQVPPTRDPQAPGVTHQTAAEPSHADSGHPDRRVPAKRADSDVRPPEARDLRERPSATAGTRPPPDHPPTTSRPPGNPPAPPGKPGETAVPPGRGPGQGQGQGSGMGSGEGSPTGFPQPDTSREPASRSGRRRRRRKARPPVSAAGDVENLDAGLPPPGVQPPGGGQGSPWHRWHGPPSHVTETDCPTHHQPEPCQRCGREDRP